MRLVIALSLLVLALGCTTQGVGARCEQNQDCNGAAGEVCRNAATPQESCGSADCICCPENLSAATAIAACTPSSRRTDAGVRD